MFWSRLRARWAPTPALAATDWADLLATSPLIAALTEVQRERLRSLAAGFLACKRITPVAPLQLDGAQRLRLAAHACLPLLEIGEAGWRGWSQVIVYPGAFRVERRAGAEVAEDVLEVVDEFDEELAGEAWEHGPLVLSWDDLDRESREPCPGFQLAVHEMAHKLDALDGVMDGTPLLPRGWQRAWASDFAAAFAELQAACEATPEGELAIDAYAAESPEEFFATTSEYHFTAPGQLASAMPAVAAHLRQLYGPPPALG